MVEHSRAGSITVKCFNNTSSDLDWFAKLKKKKSLYPLICTHTLLYTILFCNSNVGVHEAPSTSLEHYCSFRKYSSHFLS